MEQKYHVSTFTVLQYKFLCVLCPFALEVWSLVKSWAGDCISLPSSEVQSVQEWWDSALQGQSATQQRTTAAILMYTIWNIWKERNRRTFQEAERTPIQVLGLIKEERGLMTQACRRPVVP